MRRTAGRAGPLVLVKRHSRTLAHEGVTSHGPNEGGLGKPSPPVECDRVALRDRDAVAVSDDLAARDLRRVRDQRLELLVADPACDDVRRLLALLGSLEETERAEDTLIGLDQVVAGEAGQLAEHRDESLGDLARELRRAILVHTFIAANGREHVMLLRSYRDRRARSNSLLRSGRCDSRRGMCEASTTSKDNQARIHHSCDTSAPCCVVRSASSGPP